MRTKKFLNKKTTFIAKKVLYNKLTFKKLHILKLISSKRDLNVTKKYFLILMLIIFSDKKKTKIKKNLYFLLKRIKNKISLKQKVFYKKLITFFLKKKFNKKKIANNFYFKKDSKIIFSDPLNLNLKDKDAYLLYKKLIGLILKKGKKKIATHIVEKSFFFVCKYLKTPLIVVLKTILNKLKSSIESKKIQIRKATHFVPFPVSLPRKLFLITKWILISLKKNKKKNTRSKLISTIIKIVKKKKTYTSKIKQFHIQKAKENRSNAHFRW